jgi:FMN phosphatase YigB (HAD superfamily)
MLKAVLFDLDDTLLANDMDRFLPAYLGMLKDCTEAAFERDLVPAILGGVRAMIEHDDPTVPIYEVFWERFTRVTGLGREQSEPTFAAFYRERYPALAALTSPMPAARPLVDYCFERGLKVVVATNPLFPREAILARLRWAGLDAETFPFSLVTTYDNMHQTKPRSAYYEEILQVVGCAPNEAIMIGNDLDADIVPADRAGLHTLCVAASSLALVMPDGRRESALPVLDDVLGHLQTFD